MSEKRFTVDNDGIYDNQEKKHFKFIAYDWMECDIYECCEKLNEQQATIKELKEENEQLRKQCFELEKDYLIETSDISDKIYLDDEIKELKQKYGVKDE